MMSVLISAVKQVIVSGGHKTWPTTCATSKPGVIIRMKIKIGFMAFPAHQVFRQFQRTGEKKTFSGLDGETACEGHNLNPTQCLAVGCCHWANDQVGTVDFSLVDFYLCSCHTVLVISRNQTMSSIFISSYGFYYHHYVTCSRFRSLLTQLYPYR